MKEIIVHVERCVYLSMGGKGGKRRRQRRRREGRVAIGGDAGSIE